MRFLFAYKKRKKRKKNIHPHLWPYRIPTHTHRSKTKNFIIVLFCFCLCSLHQNLFSVRIVYVREIWIVSLAHIWQMIYCLCMAFSIILYIYYAHRIMTITLNRIELMIFGPVYQNALYLYMI